MKEQYVLYSTEIGIFVGYGLGMCFWTRLDSAGQTCAVAFSDKKEAADFMSRFKPEGEHHLGELQTVCVKSKTPGYATVDECVAAGLPPWDPEAEISNTVH